MKNLINLKKFWLIDPIDGTHDYINDKDEFTLNAALIIDKKPKLGIIYAPAKKRLFYSYGLGLSFELFKNEEIKITCKKKTKENQVKAVTYSDKIKPLISECHKKFGVTDYIKMKSSLKFCVIATGEFDFYAAKERAYEWDYAAGHAVAENAGAIITTLENEPFKYGKEDYKNLSLIIKRSEVLDD